MLIFSCIDDLIGCVSEEEQLAFLLGPIAFNEIRPDSADDQSEINDLCHLYAGKAGVSFPEELWTSDFFKRLAFSSLNRWGLLIELVIDALKIAHIVDARHVDNDCFCKAFTDRTKFKPGFSPFVIDQYDDAFNTEKILDMVRRAEVAKEAKAGRARKS